MCAPFAALALALPAAAQVPCSSQGVTATISPQFAAPGQVVVVTLTNGTNQVINLPSSCTYSAVYPGGACSGTPVLAPLCLAVITPIQPGQSHSMPWDQRDNVGQPVPAGTYSVSIRYWDAAFSILSTCCPTMVITSGACTGPGTDYCSAMPNSTGSPAWICALGSAIVSDNNLTLAAQGVPANQFGYFITSSTQGFFAPPASDGFVCLGGNIGRYNASVGMGPAFSLLIDLTSMPVNPPQAVQPGDTWNFQAWYRDGNSNNFTNGVAVSFL
jgi:hypothetical protein